MKVRYIGRATKGVYVPAAGVQVGHGDIAEFPKSLAESLLDSGDWQKVESLKSTDHESEAAAS